MTEATQKSISSAKEDAAMVEAFQAGNKAAFDKLVLKHKDRVFNLCYWFLGDYQEASDAAQETFIRVFRSLNRFKLESAFSTWLYRIGVNTCKNRLKSSDYRQRKKTVHLDNPGTSEGSSPFVEVRDESQSPMVEFERKEKRMLIKRAIDSLPEDQRTVVALRDIEGISYEEIAKITGLNLGTVKSKLARARLALREKLRGVI
jgi:RNA polymerase sigma-70 factor (ECF subfamily)